MGGYTKLFHTIITSTIWQEDDKTRILWITMLAAADRKGVISASLPGLAMIAKIELKDCEAALEKLLAPDVYSRTKSNEGRRLRVVDGGWKIINYEKYREKGRSTARTEYLRQKQQERREQLKECQPMSTNVNQSKPIAEAEEKAEAKKKETDLSAKDAGVEYSEDFLAFWKAHPKKKQKRTAWKAWQKVKNRPPIEDILKALEAQKQSKDWQKDGGQFIPYPATWINAGGWEDEVTPEGQPYDYSKGF